jgi:membrane protease YdiL (CAAX protease family)
MTAPATSDPRADFRSRLQDALSGRSIALALLAGVVLGLVVERFSFDFGAYCAILGVLILALRRAGVRWDDLRGSLPRGSWWRIPAVTAGLFLTSIAATWLVWYPISFFDWASVEAWLNADRSGIAEHGLLSSSALLEASLVILVVPVAEELLFRSVALRHAPGRNRRNGILWSSAIFGLLHYPEVAGSIAYGLVLSLFALRTKGLLFSILCHSLNNALVTVFLVLGRETAPSSPLTAEEFHEWAWLGAVAVVIAVPWVGRLLVRSWHEFSGDSASPALANEEVV